MSDSVAITYDNIELLSPTVLANNGQTHRFPSDFWIDKANSFVCPVGRQHGRGWLLMLGRDVIDILDPINNGAASPFKRLRFSTQSGAVQIEVVDFPRLMPVKATAITAAVWRNPDSAEKIDENAAFLLEVADERILFSKFTEIDRQYNVAEPTIPGDPTATVNYYPDSLSNGELWTWDGILADIWLLLPTSKVWPNLTWDPIGSPTFRFTGMSAWDALHTILDSIHARLIYDPILDEYSVAKAGDRDDDDAKAMELKRDPGMFGQLIYDSQPLICNTAFFPQEVNFYAPTDDWQYFTSDNKDVSALDHWENHPVFRLFGSPKNIPGGVVDGTVKKLQLPRPAVVPIPLALAESLHDPVDLQDMKNHATEMATDWARRQLVATKAVHQIYSGIHDFRPTTLHTMVGWYFLAVDFGATLGGPTTRIWSGARPPDMDDPNEMLPGGWRPELEWNLPPWVGPRPPLHKETIARVFCNPVGGIDDESCENCGPREDGTYLTDVYRTRPDGSHQILAERLPIRLFGSAMTGIWWDHQAFVWRTCERPIALGRTLEEIPKCSFGKVKVYEVLPTDPKGCECPLSPRTSECLVYNRWIDPVEENIWVMIELWPNGWEFVQKECVPPFCPEPGVPPCPPCDFRE